MAVQSPPVFLQAGSHPAEDVRRMMYSIVGQRGGIVGAGDLAVTQNGTPNMSVNIATGDVFIPGTEATYQGVYHSENRGSLNLTVTAAHATNGRRDLVVARVKDSAYSGASDTLSVEVLAGTPAGSPVDPTVPANCWVLARLTVDAAVTSIVTAKITDLRTTYPSQTRAAALGGLVVGTSTSPPTTNLYAGLPLWTTDTKSLYVYNGSTWDLVSAVATAWTAPTLLNSWVNFGGVYVGAAYRKVGDMVQLRGSIKNGTVTAGTTIYTLPVGFRPPATHVFATLDGNNAISRFDVDASGNVAIQTGTNAQFTVQGQFSTSS